jgi:hypothetical protein
MSNGFVERGYPVALDNRRSHGSEGGRILSVTRREAVSWRETLSAGAAVFR